MDLSVIIVSYNVSDYLRNCLISVNKAASGIDCEVIVIDNNSGDDSVEMVRTLFPEVTLLVNKQNLGFSAANNQGIRLSAGKFFLLLNPDTILENDAFSLCISFMQQHPEAGALGVSMYDEDSRFLPESKRALPTPSTALFKITGLSCLFPSSQIINRYYLPHIEINKTATTEVISGAFMFMRRKALEITGFLDEDFFMYGEDIDLSYRLLRTGFKNYYFPEVSIIHYKGKSTSRKKFTDIFHFYKAMRIYSAKRQKEKFSILYYIIVPAIYIRESLALANRLVKIIISN